MIGLRRALPSLIHLDVFEAAARVGNFTRAGKELGISQAAVSYAIRAVEGAIGVPLFRRQGRHVVLSEAGAVLFRDVALSLSNIRRSVDLIQTTARPGQVLLSVSSAFATFWMMPRFAAFRKRFPDIDLHVRSVDRDVDIASERMALGVRYGPGVLSTYRRALLSQEVIQPVCSPAFAKRHAVDPGAIAPKAIARLPLIHLEELHRPCPSWRDWFAAQGAPFEDRDASLRLNDYALVIQAALEDQGVALGWRHLVNPLVDRGALVKLGAREWRTKVSYFVVWAGDLSPDAGSVRDWLTAEALAAE